jgi:hypothetical protein
LMKKIALEIVTGIFLISFLFAASCGNSVSKEDYAKVVSQLSEAQSLLGEINSDNDIRAEHMAEAGVYAGFLDLLMYPSFRDMGIPVRFNFANDAAWGEEISFRANVIGDQKLDDLLTKADAGEVSMNTLADYCISRIEQALR